MYELKIFLISSFTVLGIYHICIWGGRRHDYGNLAYSLYCFALGLMIYVVRMDVNQDITIYFFPLSCHFTAGGLTFYSYIVFGLKDRVRGKVTLVSYIVLTVICFAATILFFFFRLRLFYSIYFFFLSAHGLIWIALIYVYFFVDRVFTDVKKNISIVGFTMVIGILVVSALLISLGSYVPFLIMYGTLLLNAIIFAVALSVGFNTEYKRLQQLTHHLQDEIDGATRTIREQKESNKQAHIDFAHEIKTPLQIIKGHLLTVIKKTNRRDLLPVIFEQVEKLISTVINYLDVARVEKSQLLYEHHTAVNIGTLIDQQILLRKEAAEHRNIKIRGTRAKDQIIKCNIEAADRILNNLIGNALNYTDFGSVYVDLKTEGANIVLIIRDTGIGIKEENLSRIFEPGFRGELAQKACKSGNGNGLFLVKDIIDSLQGTIDIKSRENEGTEVTVSIPAYIPDLEEAIYTSPLEEKIKTPIRQAITPKFNQDGQELPRVLIVEDNYDLRSYYMDELSERYHIFTAENGRTALELLTKIPTPDVIVCDRMMPEMDGDEFFRATREEYEKVPFIFVSARDVIEEKHKALEEGVVDYLSKPFDPVELVGKIDAHIALQRPVKETIFNLDTISSEEVRKAVMHYANEYELTRQQIEIIILQIMGMDNQNIAEQLGTTVNTVKGQKHKIIRKLPLDRSKNPIPSRYDIALLFKITV